MLLNCKLRQYTYSNTIFFFVAFDWQKGKYLCQLFISMLNFLIKLCVGISFKCETFQNHCSRKRLTDSFYHNNNNIINFYSSIAIVMMVWYNGILFHWIWWFRWKLNGYNNHFNYGRRNYRTLKNIYFAGLVSFSNKINRNFNI